MQQTIQQLLVWIRQWLPRQKNTGQAGVQVAKAGDVIVINHITTHHNHISPHNNGQQPAQPKNPEEKKRQATPAQRALLGMMKQLHDREDLVLNFMHREFGTHRVMDLDETQLYRLRRYVEVSLQNSNR